MSYNDRDIQKFRINQGQILLSGYPRQRQMDKVELRKCVTMPSTDFWYLDAVQHMHWYGCCLLLWQSVMRCSPDIPHSNAQDCYRIL